MLQTVRHRQIIQILKDRGASSVEELARGCGVSDMTIRRDLQRLAELGQLVRTHGGAAPAEQVMFEFQFLERQKVNQAAKSAIGAHAASLVHDGQSVMLDSSTTTLAVARGLMERRAVTVITTSLPIASILQQASGVETLLLGGYVRRESADLGGALTESNLENLRAGIAFVGADAIDPQGNVYNASMSVARMLGKMMASSSAPYVVADSTKIGRSALVAFGNLSKWKGLITDDGITREQREALEEAGVQVIVVPNGETTEAEQESVNHG